MTADAIPLAEVMILTIIPDVEFNAVIEQIEKKFSDINIEKLQDGSRLISVCNSHKIVLKIAVSKIFKAGNLNACLSTISGLHRFKPSFAFLCGISGNMNPDKKQLGDVVVSEFTNYMTYTKMCEGERLQQTWPPVPPLHSGMLNRVRNFLDDVGDLDFLPTNAHTFNAVGSLRRPPKMFLGKIFCWDLVLDCSVTRKRLLDMDRNFAVVEMEAAGFYKAIEFFKEQFGHPVCGLIFRGISDPAEKKQESDYDIANWRGFAAANAARALVEFIDRLGEDDFIWINTA